MKTWIKILEVRWMEKFINFWYIFKANSSVFFRVVFQFVRVFIKGFLIGMLLNYLMKYFMTIFM
jgi:hypothetical protein